MSMTLSETNKALVGEYLAARIADGACIGVGTGSTVDLAIIALGKRVKEEGLRVTVVPTSIATAQRCFDMGLLVASPLAFSLPLSLYFDGADEVDPDLRLIKGRGGALLQEKIIAASSLTFIVLIDSTKLVDKLGARCAIPIEIIPSSLPYVTNQLYKIGATSLNLRQGKESKHGPIITENGNFIIDASFPEVPVSLEAEIKSIIGVVEHGIFSGLATEVLIAENGGVRSLTGKHSSNQNSSNQNSGNCTDTN